MEMAYKEQLFMILSATMDKEEALNCTEEIAGNFKEVYRSKKPQIKPIIGNNIYKYYLDEYIENGWHSDLKSRIFIREEGKWKTFMSFNSWGAGKCREIIKRLEAGGNTVIEN